MALPLSGAEIEPATVQYGPGHADAARFRVTAPEPGPHRIRFKFIHHDTGIALQQVETDLEVADAAATRAWTRRWLPLPGRS
ncbi:hypothetical protein [Streptomyces sp. NBC_01092]|uniref:hypothetical protein n=1 Tax=Streptomyces sp. NBC_01092 TaxID=2903748 RepID=UPI0038693397|nr:hypothetical protein OG254_01260 [Streptomyces sp. NBC_01092]